MADLPTREPMQPVTIRRPEFDVIHSTARDALDAALSLDIPQSDAGNFHTMHRLRHKLHIVVVSLESWERSADKSDAML